LDPLTPSIDVIIPTFERWELTRRCLEHLREQTVGHAVFVVDNGSSDGTVENIRSDFPEVRLVASERGAGFPAACNRGVKAGANEVVVLLNNDVECRPDFLEKLVEPIRDDSSIGSAAAALVKLGGSTIDSVGLTADRTLTGFPRLRGRPASDAASGTPVLTGPAGAGGAYRRRAWEEVGGLDEHVLFYGEDLDLALRLRSAGWKTIAVPAAVAVHLGSATAGNRSAWQRYQGGFARGYFLRRYAVLRTPAGPRALLTEAVVVVGDAALSRDLSALRGRRSGWQAGRGVQRLPTPPADATDAAIGLIESLRLRRVVYAT
jgi:N-acetylglucosaminyl-diphospho-decaprenol L-rhamnosyltransferase